MEALCQLAIYIGRLNICKRRVTRVQERNNIFGYILLRQPYTLTLQAASYDIFSSYDRVTSVVSLIENANPSEENDDVTMCIGRAEISFKPKHENSSRFAY